MPVRLLTSPTDLDRYDQWVKSHPEGNLWQSVEWKTFQEALGRETKVYAKEEAGEIIGSALIIIDRTIFGLSTWDIARGPLLNGSQLNGSQLGFLEKIIADARADKCLSLYCSPSQPLSSSFPMRVSPSCRCEQLEATIMIDLTQTEEQILVQMHQKARYNMKVARKHGVRIEESKDTAAFHQLLRQTGKRDGFVILPQRHYQAFLTYLPNSFLLMAWHDETPVAGLMGVQWKNTGIYYYGASSYAHRALMAPYLLQWEAMTYCKAHECHTYDLLGISPSMNTTASIHDPWAGITEFKRKFGGKVVTYPQEQEIVLKPWSRRLLTFKRRIMG